MRMEGLMADGVRGKRSGDEVLDAEGKRWRVLLMRGRKRVFALSYI